MKKLLLIGICLAFLGCTRHYEVPIKITIVVPCKTEECLKQLEKINFEKLVNIEVDARVEKQTSLKGEADVGFNPF